MEFSWPNWFWQDIQTDRFIGIRFQDGLDRTHYGWIRCDAPDSGRVLVIKDYAYETQAGVGIIAGDMGEPVGIQTENELLFSLYPNPAEEWIEIRYYENEQLFADIRNLEGGNSCSHKHSNRLGQSYCRWQIYLWVPMWQ